MEATPYEKGPARTKISLWRKEAAQKGGFFCLSTFSHNGLSVLGLSFTIFADGASYKARFIFRS